MIQFEQGDILLADAEALVNTVNCVGIMGRGIALQFRKEFPENFKAYKAVCDRRELHPGMMLVFDLNRFENPRYVINFPTKRHWKGKSRIEDILSGLAVLVEEVRRRGIVSIAVPPLGCGLGGLDWSEVGPLIEDAFRSLPDVRVLVYEPAGAPLAEQMPKTKNVPKMTPGRAALLGLMRRYLAAVLDPFVSLLEIHKLMYFMQEAGEKLQLQFAKGPYGPYAENLRHLLNHIEGHFIKGYGDAEDNPEKQIELNVAASEQAERFLQTHPETQSRFDHVGDLIEAFETPYGMELLATVHWVARQEAAANADEAIAKVYSWNVRKRMFREQHIRIAWELLGNKGWLANPALRAGHD
jgi:O-acetyl-ADP-ribose deacetylase (regulator of RNase III)